MPKQLYKITQFHGGLNSNSDARDIAENELSEATDVMVDELGKIRLIGGIVQHYNYTNSANNPNNAAVITPGYGLFQFSHDRTEGESAGDTSPETGDDYLVMVDATNKNVDIYSRVTNTWGTAKITLGTTAGAKAAFYAVDGALRVSDGNFGAANETMWYGYIYRRFFGDDVTGYDGTGHTNGILKDKWHTDEAAIKALPISYVFGSYNTGEPLLEDNYPICIDLDLEYNSKVYTSTTDGTTEVAPDDQAIRVRAAWGTYTITDYTGSGAAYDNFCSPGDRIMTSSVGTAAAKQIYTVESVTDSVITVVEATNSTDADDYFYIRNLSRSGWYGGEEQEGWEFAVSTLYDESKQESALAKFEFTGTHTGSDDASVLTDANDKTNGLAYWQSNLLAGFIVKNLTDGSQGLITTNDGDTATATLAGGTGNDWDTGDVYSISIMSPERLIWKTDWSSTDNLDARYNFAAMRMELYVHAGDGTNDGLSVAHPRVSGFKVYMRFANTDTWYLQSEIDITKGIKTAGKETYRMWNPDVVYTSYETWVEMANAQGEYLSSMRQVETYESSSGIDSDYTSVGFDGAGTGFKTAVVANRMAYVGNVKIKDKQGNTAVHGDAVLKSHINKFDSFTLDRIIEASVNDGDSIVKLEAYADRLLIFKKNKLELLNISQEVEFLEDTFMHKGVSHPAATCKTDFGIAWVNSQGCYLYDGQKVNNLLEKQGRQIIKESDWATFTTNEPIIGYIPKKRQLLVADDNSATGTGKTFLYDIVTQSWVKGADATITSNELTNFVTDWNGDLIYAHTDAAGTVVKWSDAAEASAAVDIKTKDIDFGQPGQIKRIYKFYVTHRGSASNIQLSYAKDGDQDTYTEAGSELPVTSAVTDWVTTAITPTTFSCNSVRLRLFSDGTTPANFEINDITIVFRLKGQR